MSRPSVGARGSPADRRHGAHRPGAAAHQAGVPGEPPPPADTWRRTRPGVIPTCPCCGCHLTPYPPWRHTYLPLLSPGAVPAHASIPIPALAATWRQTRPGLAVAPAPACLCFCTRTVRWLANRPCRQAPAASRASSTPSLPSFDCLQRCCNSPPFPSSRPPCGVWSTTLHRVSCEILHKRSTRVWCAPIV